MYNLLKFLLVPLCLPLHAKSQTLPKEGRELNYRIIGFSFPALQRADTSILEIALGSYSSTDSFKKNIIKTIKCGDHKIIAEVPAFGKQYTWRVTTRSGRSGRSRGTLHHFSTGMLPCVDTTMERLRILKSAEKYKDAYVLLDCNKVMYDMRGHPVWYLPGFNDLNKTTFDRDLKVTPQGTVTLIAGSEGYEVNYDGQVLWKTPRSVRQTYHHQFTRLPNGNYMILGDEKTDLFLADTALPGESGLIAVHSDKPNADTATPVYPGSKFYQRAEFPEVTEYDTSGKIVWQYLSSRYFNRSDLYFNKRRNGTISRNVHSNGFFVDEAKGVLYISCRDISRVIKVKYPEGNTLDSYGELFTPGAVQNRGGGFFCWQHNCGVSEDGCLYLFNNNLCNAPALPTIVMMREPMSAKDSLKKVWEYQCTMKEVDKTDKKNYNFNSGGSVSELPDGSFFVNMSSDYSKLFIVNRDKEILWSALPETWLRAKKWEEVHTYRASIITDPEQLKRLIWSTEQSK